MEHMSRRRARGALLFVAVIAGALLVTPPPPARAQRPTVTQPPVSSVVLLLTPGASLSDWRGENVPTLRHLAGTGAFGVVPTGPARLSLAAACRALAFGTRTPGVRDRPLGVTLAASGALVVAVARETNPNDEAARIVAEAGATLANVPPWRVAQAQAPDGFATDPLQLAGVIRRATLPPPGRRVLVVALFDDMARVDRSAPLALPDASCAQRQAALGRLDRLLHALTAQSAGRSTGQAPDVLLVVTPQPSSEAVERGERLGPVLLWRRAGNGSGTGLLTSPSTRDTPGLAASADVAATVAGLLGADGASVGPGAGRVLEVTNRPPGENGATYLARRVAAWAAQVREQRLLVGVPWLLAFALLAGAFCRRSGRQKAAAAWGLWAASVPPGLLVAAPLAPVGAGRAWVVYALALGLSLAAPLLFGAFPRLGAPRLLQSVAALTTTALALDPWLGAPLLSRSPLSYSVIEAARYYGMGNEASGVFLGASLVTAAAALVLPRAGRVGVFAAVLLALLVTATLALPRLGADFGGLIAALAGFGTLLFAPVLGAGGRRRRAGGALFIVALLLVAAALAWDAGRPAGERTHIGQAVENVRGGGFGALQTIAARKAATAARLLVTSPWSLLLLAEVAALFLARGRGGAGMARAAFPAVAAAAAAALLVNDSGVVASAACLLYGVAAWLVAPFDPQTKTDRAEVRRLRPGPF